ncbi:hypothetical protein ATERTT37_004310 [Aspergillus terreus]
MQLLFRDPVSFHDQGPASPLSDTEAYYQSAMDVVATIFHDIFTVFVIRTYMEKFPNPQHQTMYRSLHSLALTLVDSLVAWKLEPTSDDPMQDPRLKHAEGFVDTLGWKMFAICAWSDGFSRACYTETNPLFWEALIDIIQEKYACIEVFARTRDLDWRGIILQHTHSGIAELTHALRPHPRLSDQHIHQIVRMLDGSLQRPSLNGCPQINVPHCIIDPAEFPDGDPTLRRPGEAPCDLCRSMEFCDCRLSPYAVGGLLELMEYPNKGVGVRSLGNFKQGDILGEYVGEIHDPEYEGDGIYSLMQQVKGQPHTDIALISPKQYGNWTRFMNHSCNPNTAFRPRNIGWRRCMLVEAKRDIGLFEELTVDYGASYWGDRKCCCGEPNCRYRGGDKDRDEDEEMEDSLDDQ